MPASPRAAAPIDLTGQWVAVISEDWRWRMITPAKGDIVSIPLNLQGQHVAEAWDPAKDEAAGEQCKAYGAPGLMRGPIRMRISWLDDNTLKVETDYGMQTRLFRFANAAAQPGPRSWQGATAAEWIVRGGGRGSPRFGTLKTVTTNLRPGYLRKNGVPYSERAVFTEYLGPARAAERRQIAGRHERGRRPGLPPAAVPDGDPLQARTGHQQVGSDAMRRAILTLNSDSSGGVR